MKNIMDWLVIIVFWVLMVIWCLFAVPSGLLLRLLNKIENVMDRRLHININFLYRKEH